MTDIVKRLRNENSFRPHYDVPALQREAADEIEQLRDSLHRIYLDVEFMTEYGIIQRTVLDDIIYVEARRLIEDSER